jgi:protein TonB
MKTILFKLLIFFIAQFALTRAMGQEIVNFAYVGDGGVTKDIKAAHSLIVIKQYPNNVFERLDYDLNAPLKMLRTYSDSNITTLDGKYLKYHKSGGIQVSGKYANNQKTGDWAYFNDTMKLILTETYVNNLLVKSVNPDTVKKQEPVKYADEKESDFDGGQRKWTKYLQNALDKIPTEVASLKGYVRVMFVVNTDGQTSDIYLQNSAQFWLDEEAIKIIRNSPKWNPAFQNGKIVRSYKLQPFIFKGVE